MNIDVTRILAAVERGDPAEAGKLLPLVYDELRKLAAQRLAQEKPRQTLQATALVHEAYVRLVDVNSAQQWNSRGHFFAAAAARVALNTPATSGWETVTAPSAIGKPTTRTPSTTAVLSPNRSVRRDGARCDFSGGPWGFERIDPPRALQKHAPIAHFVGSFFTDFNTQPARVPTGESSLQSDRQLCTISGRIMLRSDLVAG